jgi:CRP-like cAMP-binding protein
MYKKYKKFVSQYVSFNPVEWKLFKAKLKESKHNKGEIIHYSGEICTDLMFINYGIIRAYILSANGSDHTWSIFFNDKNSEMTNVYAIDYDSFINQRNSRLSFEVLEDCQLLSLSYDDLQFLYKYSKKAEKFGRLMAELAYSYTHNLIIDRLTKSASERYNNFIAQTPYLLEKVPQYHIATLLGITPQSLSRIKKEQGNYPR